MSSTLDPIRLLIIHNNTLLLQCLACALKQTASEIEVVGVWNGDPREIPPSSLDPNLILLDSTQYSDYGWSAAIMGSMYPSATIMIFGAIPDQAYLNHARAAGVDGFFNSLDDVSLLVAAVRLVARGYCLHSRDVALLAFQSPVSTVEPYLTARQQQILQLVQQGRSNKEIATSLAISLKTVEGHITRILRTLNLQSRVEMRQAI